MRREILKNFGFLDESKQGFTFTISSKAMYLTTIILRELI